MEKEKGKDVTATGSLVGGGYEAEDLFEGAEPWSPIETKVVAWSFVAAAVALVVLGTLINIYILK